MFVWLCCLFVCDLLFAVMLVGVARFGFCVVVSVWCFYFDYVGFAMIVFVFVVWVYVEFVVRISLDRVLLC